LSKLASVSWNEMVRRLRELGFEGPYLSSGPHPYYLKKGDLILDLPNPHKQDIGIDLLKKVLKRAEVSREEWLSV
jgi:predicted RNA binding protein YcfA (HicA-like mRNA interferase family)